jgi:hypothetical protein
VLFGYKLSSLLLEKSPISTISFPQIFLKKENSVESLFLGGYSDLNEFINTFMKIQYNVEDVNKFQNKYYWWSKKAVLRSIQLINNY